VLSDPRVSLAAAVPAASAELVLESLDRIRPIVRIGANEPAAANAAASLLAMLSRVFAHTTLDGNASLGGNPWAAPTLAHLETALASVRPAPVRAPEVDLVIAIGAGAVGADWWVGGDDWTAAVSRQPVAVRARALSLGLQAAAALAVGEAVKPVLAALGLSTVSTDGELVWNLVNYRCEKATDLISDHPSRPDVAVLGCGSVGTSFGAVLSFEESVTGSCVAVDGDSFDPTRNPYRYPALRGSESASKAAWMAALLKAAGWESGSMEMSVGEWVASRDEPGFAGIAVASVDDRSGRMEVTDLLAETTLSVGVGGLALHLEREHLGDGYACPFCEYVSLAPASTQAGVFAAATGLDIARVLQLQEGGALSLQDVATSVASGHLRAEQAESMVGRRLADLVRAGYAEASVAATGGAIRVAAPQVSWLAGLLPAAEVVKSALGLPLIDRRVDIDLAGLPTGFVRSVPADKSGRCLCASPWRNRWMTRSRAS
jgi:hypothetical protein